MKIFITGAKGQVGTALVNICTARGVEFRAAGRAELDISDEKAVLQAISDYQPDVIINAAAYTAVDKAESEPEAAELINHVGPANLGRAAQHVGAALFHISTDFVFDGKKPSAYVEGDVAAPLSVYGMSKYRGEMAVANNAPRHIILRTSWVFGGIANFVNTMRRLAKERDEISVVDDQRGGPTPAAEIANALMTIASDVMRNEFRDWGIYHFSGTPAVSWYEFAVEILKSEAVSVLPIPTSGYPTPAVRPANSVLSCDKIDQVFGISQPDWRDYL